jgi:hypothetical protein
LVYSVIFAGMCRHTPSITTQYCTTLQPSISTHTQIHTNKHQNTHIHTKTIRIMQFRMLIVTILLYVNCFFSHSILSYSVLLVFVYFLFVSVFLYF